MKILGARFLDALRRPERQHPPRAAAVVPRACTGARDALAYGVKVTGCTAALRRRRRRHRPDRRAGRRARALDDDDEDSLHERIKVAERALLVGPSAGWPARAGRHRGQEGLVECRMQRRRERPVIGDQARADQRLRQDRAGGARPRASTQAGVELVSTGSHRGARSPRPACRSRRSRSSPASPSASTAGSRPCTRRCTPASSPTAASPSTRAAARRARRRAVRPGRGQPLPVRRRPSPPAPPPDECVEQIDIGGPSMVRAAAKNHPSVAVVVDPAATTTCSRPSTRRRVHARRERQRLAARGVRAHRGVRRRGGVAGSRAR